MTKGCCSIATCTAIGDAFHARPADEDMSFTRETNGLADKAHKSVARFVRVGIRARMTDITRPVHLPSRNARETDMRSLCTPYRPITIPDTNWRAVE